MKSKLLLFFRPFVMAGMISVVALPCLARTFYQLSAAAGDAPYPAVFAPIGVLDVLSSTTTRPSGRKPHWARHLAGLATNAGEKCGLPEKPTPTPTPGPGGGEKSLTDIAKNIELKGGEKGKSIVISNENLSDYASQRELTAVSKKEKQAVRPIHGPGARTVVTPSSTGRSEERKRYWQGKYKQQLELIAGLKRQIDILDYQIPGLWRDFYAWDDPAYRDGVIKPKLDSALAKRDALEARVRQEEPRLQEIKTLARQDGAEPGWFREIAVPTAAPPSPTPEMIDY